MADSDRGWFDPDFCEHRCPVCTRARKGNRLARVLQAIESIITFGGCPFGRARQRKYGVKPSEPLKPDNESRPEQAQRTTRRLPVVRSAVIFLALAILAIWWMTFRIPGVLWCAEHFQKKNAGPALPPADPALKALADELRGEVKGLAVDIGERNVGRRPKQLDQAADYIEGRFKAAGYTVTRQPYDVAKTKCYNLEVSIAGKTRPKEIVVVGAHYDTVANCPGANDNTSGIAATLALARKFAKRPGARTLRFVAFTNEEPPYFQTDQMGSRVYARQCRQQRDNIVAMLSLETIGCYDDRRGSQKYPPPFSLLYPSTGNFIAFIGNTGSRGLVSQSAAVFNRNEKFPVESAAMPAAIPGVGFSDQWSFWQEDYSGIMVTDTALYRYPHYHQKEDTIDKINFDRMGRVVRGLEEVVADLAGVE